MDLQKTLKELSHNEKKVLLTLQTHNGEATPHQLLQTKEFSKDVEIMNAASWLQSKKLVTINEHITTTYHVGSEGERFLKSGFPEKNALKHLEQNNGTLPLNELSKHLDKTDATVAIGWLKRNRWADITKEDDGTKKLIITEQGKQALNTKTAEENLLETINDNSQPPQPDIHALKNLLSRKNVLKEKESVHSTISLTEHGKELLKSGITIQEEITQITSAIIKNQEWKNKHIRAYDINAFTPNLYGGKAHPLVELIEELRELMVQMGFSEITGNYVESSFWNMDVLFIPQDHPARELQDTFYLKTPKEIQLNDTELIKKIADVHQTGADTGSTGWKYHFDSTQTTKALLRTHTTVNTIRYLKNNPTPPCKVFSIEKVFRKESIDSTHLPEFFQIEGIIHDKNANFRQLLGTIKELYKKMGFEKIRFRPGYFPYTEPSMEVEVYYNNKWMELGGSGIFRPEVTKPVGVNHPVLAWGLGLERLAMLRFGLKDIRNLYISDLEWLQKQPLYHNTAQRK